MQDWLQIVLRTLAAMVILFFLTKLLGKRQISELSLFEYITGISIGNIAAYISLDLENLWYLGIISLCVWVSVSVGIEFVTMKSKKIRDYVDGKGTVLIKNGKLQKKQLYKERLTIEELLEQLRQKDVHRVADVEFAIMEPSGELDILLKKKYQPLTPDMLGLDPGTEKPSYTVIVDGKLVEEELRQSGVSPDTVQGELKRHSLAMGEVFLGQVDGEGQLYFHTPDGRVFAPAKQPSAQAPFGIETIRQMSGQLEMVLRQPASGGLDSEERKEYETALRYLRKGMAASGQKNK